MRKFVFLVSESAGPAPSETNYLQAQQKRVPFSSQLTSELAWLHLLTLTRIL
jgi:hypothetical protein